MAFDDDRARAALERMRWRGSPICPACSARTVHRIRSRGILKCGRCRTQFTVTSGTALHGCRVAPSTIAAVLHQIAQGHTATAASIARTHDVAPRTASLLLRRAHLVAKEWSIGARRPREGLAAPFPYFGGKRQIAAVVWDHLGDVERYIEPFCGSAAVLLARPERRGRARAREVVNDASRFIANFWRALQAAPDEVAVYCDAPENETDMVARHRWLITEGARLVEGCDEDPGFYDARCAGYWAWRACCWVGSDRVTDRHHAKPNTTSKGVNRRTYDDWETSGYVPMNLDLREYLAALSARLRRVRVLCGDWSRVVKPSELDGPGITGVFLDPPYDNARRWAGLYSHDRSVGVDVQRWCLEHGHDTRVVLAGYDGEYVLPGWRVIEWTARRAYASSRPTPNEAHRSAERLWISPLCL